MFVTQEKIEEMVSELADRMYTYAHFITEYCLNVIDTEDYQVKEKRFFYTLLFKASNELTAVSTLFKNFYQKAAFQSSMYLIIRTMLSDCFAAWHVIKLKELGEDHLYMIDLIDYDHVSFSIKTLKGSYNLIHRLKKSEIDDAIQAVKSSNSRFFNYTVKENGQKVYGENIFGKDFYSLRNTISFLTQQKLIKEEKEILIKMFYYYDYYSKLEHPGVLTFQLVHKSFDQLAFKKSLRDLIENIFIIEPFIATYMKNWPELENSISSNYLSVTEKMYKKATELWEILKMEAI